MHLHWKVDNITLVNGELLNSFVKTKTKNKMYFSVAKLASLEATHLALLPKSTSSFFSVSSFDERV